jgi:hypothetical protein
MVYILFNRDKIFGVYGTLTMLQANCYIFVYQLYNTRKLDRDTYMKIKTQLDELALDSLESLQKTMAMAYIDIESHDLENDSFKALENISKHIDFRFDTLEELLGKDSRVNVTFPGNSALDNMMVTAEIETVWREMDPDNYLEVITKLKKLIIRRISTLQLMFESRVKFGNVSDKQASTLSYQVWPADIGNWNLPNNSPVYGEGFAVCFQYQVPGVYGIVTNPYYGYKF